MTQMSVQFFQPVPLWTTFVAISAKELYISAKETYISTKEL